MQHGRQKNAKNQIANEKNVLNELRYGFKFWNNSGKRSQGLLDTRRIFESSGQNISINSCNIVYH